MTTDLKRIDPQVRTGTSVVAWRGPISMLVSFSVSWRNASSKRECADRLNGPSGRAKCSYEATQQLLNRVENERNEVQKKIERLSEKLDSLSQELNQAA